MRRFEIAALMMVGCLVLGASTVAQADSIEYGFEAGSVTLVGSVGTDVRITETFPMTGIQVTVDTDVPQLDSLEFTADPVTLAIVPPGSSYAGLTEIDIIQFSLTHVGPTPITLVDAATGEYSLDVPAQLLLELSVSGTPPAGFPVGPTVTSLPSLTGTMFVDEAAGGLALNGISLGALGPWGDESDEITLTANLQFIGLKNASGSGGATPTPEPSGVLLFAVGALIVGGALRRSLV